MPAPDTRTLRHQPWLDRFCYLALVSATFLLFLGGETTSNQAGMAFQTWPLSNGSLNPAGWLHDLKMFLEHSHRLVAGLTSILTIIAALWIQFTESRRWVRRLAWIVVGAIFLQAVVGGLRVLLDPSNTGSSSGAVKLFLLVFHAMMAEVTVLLWVTLALTQTRGWIIRGVGANLVAPSVRRWGHIACAAIFLQIFAGAIMRHGGFAFAIPTFPWNGPDHALLPAEWSWPVAVNFVHRLGACVVTIALIGLSVNVYRDAPARRQLGSWMTLILFTVIMQIGLGTEVMRTNKNANVATLHLLTGAFLLASTWLLTFLSYRSKWWPNDAADYTPRD